MSTRALYRIFGLFLLTWSIVDCVPLARPEPPDTNVTTETVKDQKDANFTNTTSSTKETKMNVSVNDSTQAPNATSITEVLKTAPVTAVPTSEYVELTNIENITDLFQNGSRNESSELNTNKSGTNKKNEYQMQSSVTSTESTEKRSSTVMNNTDSILSSISPSSLNDTYLFINDTKQKPDIVTVFDSNVNYDTFLPNFMNASTIKNNTAENENITITTISKNTIMLSNVTSKSGKKYSTLNRKRTTKSKDETTTLASPPNVSDHYKYADKLENVTETPSDNTKESGKETSIEPISKVMRDTSLHQDPLKNSTLGNKENLEKISKVPENFTVKENQKSETETLKEIASTWNRTTYSAQTTEKMKLKDSDKMDKNLTNTTNIKNPLKMDASESGVLASKRSGYLDNFKLTLDTTTPDFLPLTEKETEHDSYSVELTKPNATVASKIQLVEDALNEERRKEWSLNANREVTFKHELSTENTETTTVSISTTEGQLASNARQNASINPLLYKVNSNYKPLKKLEVQPHKSFTIDPDDNSWRNESIHSRGIVYKPKNSTKPFTQVLKNKTESEWHNLQEKEFKDEEVELKERLEKIAAKRKNKKKLTNANTSTTAATLNEVFLKEDETNNTTPYLPIFDQVLFTTSSPMDEFSTTQASEKPQYDNNGMQPEKPVEHLNNADAYDTYDEDERYISITQFDLLKTTPTSPKIKTPSYPQKAFTHSATTAQVTTHYPPNRKGTIEYFPPQKTQKVSYNDYDFQFKNKLNAFTTDFVKNRIEPLAAILTTTARQPQVSEKIPEPSVYIMPPYETRVADVEDSGYVIKHYKDLVSKAAAEARGPEPASPRPPPNPAFHPRSGIVQKFVASFNRNADKLKEEFPILYNTNIVHSGGDDGRIVASSSAYLRRLHAPHPPLTPASILDSTRRYDPTCVNHTVDLSPAYELHYFVNDEEQKQPSLLDPVPQYNDFI